MSMLFIVTMPIHFEMIYFLFPVDEDEVGDRITVRSDEEMKAMLSYVSIYSPVRFLSRFFFIRFSKLLPFIIILLLQQGTKKSQLVKTGRKK